MSFPAFFALAPSITLTDPLCRFLGAGDGVITYGYEDAVKLAGHSCPTVAGTWLMLTVGLAALWPEGIPERGGIAVYLPDAAESGTAGVIASVASLITGARGGDGFKGIAGEFERRNRLFYEAPVPGDLGLRRLDTQEGIALNLDLSSIPSDPQMPELLGAWRSGQADDEDLKRFGLLWQDRVRRIFLAGSQVVQAVSWP